MISAKDISELKKVFATKEEFADLRLEVGDLKYSMDGGFDQLNIKLDRFLGNLEAVQLDNSAGAVMLYRHERCIQVLAYKADITLPED